jgi:hypothetical protein
MFRPTLPHYVCTILCGGVRFDKLAVRRLVRKFLRILLNQAVYYHNLLIYKTKQILLLHTQSFVGATCFGMFMPSSGSSNTKFQVKSSEVSSYYRPRGPRRESRGIVLRFSLNLGTLDGGEWSTSRPGRLYPGKDPVRIVQVVGWVSEPVWRGAENIAPTGIPSPDLPARSESPYRLCHPGSH